MGYFSADNSTGDLGAGVNAIYIKLSTGTIAEIYPTRLTVNRDCKFVGSPSEMGLVVFDNKVQQPGTADLIGILKASSFSVISRILTELGENKVHRSTVYTKEGSMENMEVELLSENYKSECFDGVEVHIRMREYLEEDASY